MKFNKEVKNAVQKGFKVRRSVYNPDQYVTKLVGTDVYLLVHPTSKLTCFLYEYEINSNDWIIEK